MLQLMFPVYNCQYEIWYIKVDFEFLLWNIENSKINGITIETIFVIDITQINFEIITQFEWMHILYFKLASNNTLDAF